MTSNSDLLEKDDWKPETAVDIAADEIAWGRAQGEPTAELEQALTDAFTGRGTDANIVNVLRGGHARE